METYASSWNQWLAFCGLKGIPRWEIDQLAACAFAVWRAYRQKGYGKKKNKIVRRKWKTIRKDFRRAKELGTG